MSTENKPIPGFRIRFIRLPKNHYHLESSSWRAEENSTLFATMQAAETIFNLLVRKPRYRNQLEIKPNRLSYKLVNK